MKKLFCQLGRMLGVILGCSIPSTAAASGLELIHPVQSALSIVIVRIFIQLVKGYTSLESIKSLLCPR